MSRIEDEIARLDRLSPIALALVEFARTLADGDFVAERSGWVFRPMNFVAVRFHYARTETIAFTLHGNWTKFRRSELEAWSGRTPNWSTCRVKHPRQLAAAALYLETAAQLHAKSPHQGYKYRLETHPKRGIA